MAYPTLTSAFIEKKKLHEIHFFALILAREDFFDE